MLQDGRTPLIWAACDGRTDIVKYLVAEAKATVEAAGEASVVEY